MKKRKECGLSVAANTEGENDDIMVVSNFSTIHIHHMSSEDALLFASEIIELADNRKIPEVDQREDNCESCFFQEQYNKEPFECMKNLIWDLSTGALTGGLIYLAGKCFFAKRK